MYLRAYLNTPWLVLACLQVQEGPSHCVLRLLAEVQVQLTGPGQLLPAEEAAAAPTNAHKPHLPTQRSWGERGGHAGEHSGTAVQGAGHVAQETGRQIQVKARPSGSRPQSTFLCDGGPQTVL